MSFDAAAYQGGPLKILFSACLTGVNCGVDGSCYEVFSVVRQIAACPKVTTVIFCPEDFSFGTPRQLPSIHGGHGGDVLDGKARVLTESGEDWTRGMIDAAEAMLRLAQSSAVDLAILMDISPSCGSRVIYRGFPREKNYQKGAGVAAELLRRNGLTIFTQRDYRTLQALLHKLDPSFVPDEAAIDHHEDVWYRGYFKSSE